MGCELSWTRWVMVMGQAFLLLLTYCRFQKGSDNLNPSCIVHIPWLPKAVDHDSESMITALHLRPTLLGGGDGGTGGREQILGNCRTTPKPRLTFDDRFSFWPPMNIRDGEVPTPRPGTLLKSRKPTTAYAGWASKCTREHTGPRQALQELFILRRDTPTPPTSKSRSIPTSSIDDDLRPSKRLRTTLDLSDVSPNPQTKASVDTESQEASSTMSLTGRSPDSKLQLRQSEYRNVAIVASSRTRKRRMRRLRTRRSQGPESIDDSDRSSIISVSPNPASLDELRNDATPTPKRAGPSSRAAPDIKGHAQRPPRDDISEDELAIGGVGRVVLPTKAKGALSKDGLGTSPRAVAKVLSGISLSRAASGSQVHEPDEKFAFAPQPGNEKVWQAITLAGEAFTFRGCALAWQRSYKLCMVRLEVGI
ncbi:unnamed protein product [Parascedosporium putredinis]|uniref:Uncharacterized protein n=1 Tax=Parascedosporium putredinis TaxID=1442378 RepID=A0A9P1MCN4_9PEZI|nr:unnamed protein product [Parascedosporium putredinis]CAI7998733.1 unnamed protein product [Parascedosporium putredinis]